MRPKKEADRSRFAQNAVCRGLMDKKHSLSDSKRGGSLYLKEEVYMSS
jgi:hypothetical protein